MAAPRVFSMPSLDLADRCELRIGLSTGHAIWVALSDGREVFTGEVGSVDPLWAVLNGAKAAARSKRTLLGLAREGNEIDVVAYERGKGVQLASRFSPISYSELLRQIQMAKVAGTSSGTESTQARLSGNLTPRDSSSSESRPADTSSQLMTGAERPDERRFRAEVSKAR